MSHVTYIRIALKQLATLPFQGQGVLVMLEDVVGNPLCDWSGTGYVAPLTSAASAAVQALVSGGGIQRKQTLTALSASIAAARVKNYQTAAPLLAMEALPASTVVYLGQIYSSGGAAWAVITQGTTAAGAPSVPGNAGDSVTNGTAVLFYLGPVKAVAAANPDTPASFAAVTVASLGGGTKVYTMSSSSGLMTVTAATGKYMKGAYLQGRGPYSGGVSWYGDSSNASLIGFGECSSLRYGFVTSSKRVGIMGSGQIPVYINAEVNGSPIVEFGICNQRAGANPGTWLITFADRRPREIWFHTHPSSGLDQIIVDAGEQIAPAAAGSLRIVVEGDSLTAGGNNNPVTWRCDWPSILADYCGVKDVWNMAVGGTGFVAAGSSSNPFTNTTRIAQVIASNPDVLIVAGDHNDRLDTSVNRLAAMRSWFTTIRAALPNVSIVVFGSTLLLSEINSGSTQTDLDLATVVAERNAAGDALIDFIPVGTAATVEPWLLDANVGTPYYSTNTGDGHPSHWGIQYLASRYVAAFQAWVAANA